MSATMQRAVVARTAQVNALLALLAQHLGPVELVAVLPRRSPRWISGSMTPESKGSDDPQGRLFPARQAPAR